MATMSAARIRSLCRRHNHADEAVYRFSAIPADERFRAALRRERAKAGLT